MRLSPSVLLLLLAWTAPLAAAEIPDPAVTASALDRQLATEMTASSDKATVCSDETYLRRVTLDLLGRNPSPSEIKKFKEDASATKRRQLVERLLNETAYGENWAKYWRDVIMFRRSEDRALIANPALNSYLTEQFNKNTSWDKIAASFITAEGDVTEKGETALFMAQMGRPEETTAEVARIFLGIQIQCAQCHDHPTDRWKREQFHQLTAFFPRVAVRPVRMEEKRSFEVVGSDAARRGARPMNANRYVGAPEHYMPDLEDPTARGKLMSPVFFVTGERVKLGTADEDRRTTLAKWLTAPTNEWFAKAYVNRLWSELVGEGFYEPVDDMGPDRECHAPQTLKLLSEAFVASGHDTKWLFTTILSTEAYQHRSEKRREPNEQPFQHNVAQRLRSDQLYANLVSALGAPNAPMAAAGRMALRNPRNGFAATFAYDPSTRRDEVAGSIPQALALMNSPLVTNGIEGRFRSPLAAMVRETTDNRALATKLYMQTLAREPTKTELETFLGYARQATTRVEAFEDLQWALVNSTEFLHRR